MLQETAVLGQTDLRNGVCSATINRNVISVMCGEWSTGVVGAEKLHGTCGRVRERAESGLRSSVEWLVSSSCKDRGGSNSGGGRDLPIGEGGGEQGSSPSLPERSGKLSALLRSLGNP